MLKYFILIIILLFLGSCAQTKQDLINMTAENYHVKADHVKMHSEIDSKPIYFWIATVDSEKVVCTYAPNYAIFNYGALSCHTSKEIEKMS
ncbi:hypothetical protein AB9G22_03640 [Francisella philomiragia]|uniref:hypothetical protein n=1 Tax=Francisella philomiragia TaxID=28110 RepID=UPI0035140A6C